MTTTSSADVLRACVEAMSMGEATELLAIVIVSALGCDMGGLMAPSDSTTLVCCINVGGGGGGGCCC